MKVTMDNVDVFIEKFIAAVDFQEPIPITADSEFSQMPEWDSLAALGVIVMFDMEYGKTITGDHLQKVTTISDLYQLLA